MRTIAIANEKGGVGKTTLATHLVWHLVEAGRKVLAIDLDQQANLTATLLDHRGAISADAMFLGLAAAPPPSPTLAGATPQISDLDRGSPDAIRLFCDAVLASALHYDVCVIDTPPALHNIRTTAALYAADAVIAPLELGEYSLAGVTKLLSAIQAVPSSFNRVPIQFLGLLPWKYYRASRRERELYAALMEEGRGVVFPGSVARRDSYARSASEKRPVWKMPGTASREAAAEIRPILSEIERLLNIETPVPLVQK